jgi:hypothetical protein
VGRLEIQAEEIAGHGETHDLTASVRKQLGQTQRAGGEIVDEAGLAALLENRALGGIALSAADSLQLVEIVGIDRAADALVLDLAIAAVESGTLRNLVRSTGDDAGVGLDAAEHGFHEGLFDQTVQAALPN